MAPVWPMPASSTARCRTRIDRIEGTAGRDDTLSAARGSTMSLFRDQKVNLKLATESRLPDEFAMKISLQRNGLQTKFFAQSLRKRL
jgi:hypothetical protein